MAEHVFLTAARGKRTHTESVLSIMTHEILGEMIRPKSRRELIKLSRASRFHARHSRAIKRIYDALDATRREHPCAFPLAENTLQLFCTIATFIQFPTSKSSITRTQNFYLDKKNLDFSRDCFFFNFVISQRFFAVLLMNLRINLTFIIVIANNF